MSSPSPVQPGDVLAGKYQVERVLGIGGMGIVVAAKHLQLEERVAIKFMLEEALRIPDAVPRFLREAKAAARLKSEHVAKVSDVGTLDSGSPYMVMEYLEGADLGELVALNGALPAASVVDYVLQACEALAEAHSVGIIHRDLKPANLFLANRPGGTSVVKVLDFGISKVTSPGGKDSRVTGTTSLVGSPTYMSPEQLKSSRDVDARADVWALGVTMFELLSGNVPYEGDTMPVLCARILTEEPRDLGTLREDLPEGLAGVVMRCLVRDPAARIQDVAELATLLAPYGNATSQLWVERAAMLLDSAPGAHAPRIRSAPSLPAISEPARSQRTQPTGVAPPGAGRTTTSFGASTLSASRVPKGVLVGVIGTCVLFGGGFAMFTAGRSSNGATPPPDAAVVATLPPSAGVPLAPPPTSAAPPGSAPATPPPIVSAAPAKSSATKAPKPKPSVIPGGGSEDDLYGARR